MKAIRKTLIALAIVTVAVTTTASAAVNSNFSPVRSGIPFASDIRSQGLNYVSFNNFTNNPNIPASNAFDGDERKFAASKYCPGGPCSLSDAFYDETPNTNAEYDDGDVVRLVAYFHNNAKDPHDDRTTNNVNNQTAENVKVGFSIKDLNYFFANGETQLRPNAFIYADNNRYRDGHTGNGRSVKFGDSSVSNRLKDIYSDVTNQGVVNTSPVPITIDDTKLSMANSNLRLKPLYGASIRMTVAPTIDGNQRGEEQTFVFQDNQSRTIDFETYDGGTESVTFTARIEGDMMWIEADELPGCFRYSGFVSFDFLVEEIPQLPAECVDLELNDTVGTSVGGDVTRRLDATVTYRNGANYSDIPTGHRIAFTTDSGRLFNTSGTPQNDQYLSTPANSSERSNREFSRSALFIGDQIESTAQVFAVDSNNNFVDLVNCSEIYSQQDTCFNLNIDRQLSGRLYSTNCNGSSCPSPSANSIQLTKLNPSASFSNSGIDPDNYRVRWAVPRNQGTFLYDRIQPPGPNFIYNQLSPAESSSNFDYYYTRLERDVYYIGPENFTAVVVQRGASRSEDELFLDGSTILCQETVTLACEQLNIFASNATINGQAGQRLTPDLDFNNGNYPTNTRIRWTSVDPNGTFYAPFLGSFIPLGNQFNQMPEEDIFYVGQGPVQAIAIDEGTNETYPSCFDGIGLENQCTGLTLDETRNISSLTPNNCSPANSAFCPASGSVPLHGLTATPTFQLGALPPVAKLRWEINENENVTFYRFVGSQFQPVFLLDNPNDNTRYFYQDQSNTAGVAFDTIFYRGEGEINVVATDHRVGGPGFGEQPDLDYACSNQLTVEPTLCTNLSANFVPVQNPGFAPGETWYRVDVTNLTFSGRTPGPGINYQLLIPGTPAGETIPFFIQQNSTGPVLEGDAAIIDFEAQDTVFIDGSKQVFLRLDSQQNFGGTIETLDNDALNISQCSEMFIPEDNVCQDIEVDFNRIDDPSSVNISDPNVDHVYEIILNGATFQPGPVPNNLQYRISSNDSDAKFWVTPAASPLNPLLAAGQILIVPDDPNVHIFFNGDEDSLFVEVAPRPVNDLDESERNAVIGACLERLIPEPPQPRVCTDMTVDFVTINNPTFAPGESQATEVVFNGATFNPIALTPNPVTYRVSFTGQGTLYRQGPNDPRPVPQSGNELVLRSSVAETAFFTGTGNLEVDINPRQFPQGQAQFTLTEAERNDVPGGCQATPPPNNLICENMRLTIYEGRRGGRQVNEVEPGKTYFVEPITTYNDPTFNNNNNFSTTYGVLIPAGDYNNPTLNIPTILATQPDSRIRNLFARNVTAPNGEGVFFYAFSNNTRPVPNAVTVQADGFNNRECTEQVPLATQDLTCRDLTLTVRLDSPRGQAVQNLVPGQLYHLSQTVRYSDPTFRNTVRYLSRFGVFMSERDAQTPGTLRLSDSELRARFNMNVEIADSSSIYFLTFSDTNITVRDGLRVEAAGFTNAECEEVRQLTPERLFCEDLTLSVRNDGPRGAVTSSVSQNELYHITSRITYTTAGVTDQTVYTSQYGVFISEADFTGSPIDLRRTLPLLSDQELARRFPSTITSADPVYFFSFDRLNTNVRSAIEANSEQSPGGRCVENVPAVVAPGECIDLGYRLFEGRRGGNSVNNIAPDTVYYSTAAAKYSSTNFSDQIVYSTTQGIVVSEADYNRLNLAQLFRARTAEDLLRNNGLRQRVVVGANEGVYIYTFSNVADNTKNALNITAQGSTAPACEAQISLLVEQEPAVCEDLSLSTIPSPFDPSEPTVINLRGNYNEHNGDIRAEVSGPGRIANADDTNPSFDRVVVIPASQVARSNNQLQLLYTPDSDFDPNEDTISIRVYAEGAEDTCSDLLTTAPQVVCRDLSIVRPLSPWDYDGEGDSERFEVDVRTNPAGLEEELYIHWRVSNNDGEWEGSGDEEDVTRDLENVLENFTADAEVEVWANFDRDSDAILQDEDGNDICNDSIAIREPEEPEIEKFIYVEDDVENYDDLVNMSSASDYVTYGVVFNAGNLITTVDIKDDSLVDGSIPGTIGGSLDYKGMRINVIDDNDEYTILIADDYEDDSDNNNPIADSGYDERGNDSLQDFEDEFQCGNANRSDVCIDGDFSEAVEDFTDGLPITFNNLHDGVQIIVKYQMTNNTEIDAETCAELSAGEGCGEMFDNIAEFEASTEEPLEGQICTGNSRITPREFDERLNECIDRENGTNRRDAEVLDQCLEELQEDFSCRDCLERYIDRVNRLCIEEDSDGDLTYNRDCEDEFDYSDENAAEEFCEENPDSDEETFTGDDDARAIVVCPYILSQSGGDVFFTDVVDTTNVDIAQCSEITPPPVVVTPPPETPRTPSTGADDEEEFFLEAAQDLCTYSNFEDQDIEGYSNAIKNFSSSTCELEAEIAEIWTEENINQAINANITRLARFGSNLNEGGDVRTISSIDQLNNVDNAGSGVFIRDDGGSVRINLGSNTVGPSGDVPGAMTIIVRGGDLYIDSNVLYDELTPDSFLRADRIPSIAFVVLDGNIIINNNVTQIDGIVMAADLDDSEDDGKVTNSSFGRVATDNLLTINGSLIGDVFDLFATRLGVGDPARNEGSVTILYDERVLLSTPPGIGEFVDLTQRPVAN